MSGKKEAECILFVSVVQWIARRTSNPEVVGSSPTGDAFYSFENYNDAVYLFVLLCTMAELHSVHVDN